MKHFWNERYQDNEYAFGEEANVFFKNSLDKYDIKGKLLFPAEGEGRNCVYAATKNNDCYAFDLSDQGKIKADKLAQKFNVSIDYQVGDFFELNLSQEKFDAAVLIYFHLPPPMRLKFHKKIAETIKPGGWIVLEAFSVNNLEYRQNNPAVGGPDKSEMLYSTEIMEKDFPDFDIVSLEEVETTLAEGKYHNGLAKVIRFIAQKN